MRSLGTYCSGGVDSSLLTAYAARQYTGQLKTFTVGFKEPEFDESSFSEKVARRFGTSHHKLVIDDKTYADALPKAIWLLESPLNHAHSVHLYLLSKLVKESVTVMLTGEGSDELFGGYPRYRLLMIRLLLEHLPSPFRKGLFHCLAPFETPRIRKIRSALSAPLDRVIVKNAEFVEAWAAREVSADGLECTGKERVGFLEEAKALGADPLGQLLYLDMKTYLVALLDRQDKMSMGASIEARVPFLDYRIVEWSLRIQASKKIHKFENKFIVKLLASRYLPREVVYRKKSGFGVPVGLWLRSKTGLGRYLELLQTKACEKEGCGIQSRSIG